MSALSTVIARGTLAARPAAGNSGRIYTVTDSGTTYRDNGSSWDIIAPLAVTSMPGTPTTGVPVWRSDTAMWAYHDGTRWLSATLYHMPLAGPFDGSATAAANGWPFQAVAGTIISRASLWHTDFAIYLVSFYGDTYVSTTNNGTNFWTIALSGAVTGTAYGNFTTAADTANTQTGHAATLNVVAGATERGLLVNGTKTLAPGNIYAPLGVTYRLILT